MRHARTRTAVAVGAVIAALVLTLLPTAAFANHEGNSVDISPESQSHQAGDSASLSATVGSNLSIMSPNIDFEIESGPGDTDGNTPKTPDMTCSPLVGLLGCSVSYSSSKRGVDVIRAWIDLDSSDATNEYDNDEGLDETKIPGHPEPDITDVVQVLWTLGPPMKLDCDDSNFNDTETNFSTGPSSGEVYTCKVSDGGGVGMEGFAIDGENLSTTGVNDPEAPDADYNNFCVTGGNGICQGVIPSQGKTGTAEICFWADADDDATYDPTAAQGSPNFGEYDGGDCDGETVAEAENNDLTDVVQITWTPETTPPVTRVDRPLQNGTYLDTALTTFSGVARDSLSTVVKVEIALRKYLVSGKCKNWSGSMFVSADCGARTWVLATIKSTDPDTAIVNWTYDLPAGTRLARSDERNGAAARVYLLLARATDSVGNVETVFVDTNCTVSNQHPRGCNRITFEIKASGT